ncbi:hypothetical protein ES703_85533 [subsurface metagenome]
MGIITAGRIRDLVDELELRVDNIYLIINRSNPELNENLIELIKEKNLNLLGIIPEDENLIEYSLNEKSILDLPTDSLSFLAVNAIIQKLLI